MEKESLLVCVTLGDSAQHMIRRRDEKMAMIMPGNTNALGTTLLQHLNGGGGISQLGQKTTTKRTHHSGGRDTRKKNGRNSAGKEDNSGRDLHGGRVLDDEDERVVSRNK